jgi:hypothetical protein
MSFYLTADGEQASVYSFSSTARFDPDGQRALQIKICKVKMPRYPLNAGHRFHPEAGQLTAICLAEGSLAFSFLGKESLNTPSSYFASIFSRFISSGRVKLLLKEE